MERLRLLVEGVNNKIRVLQRRAYGYRDEEYLKLKIVAAFLPPLPRNAVFNPVVSENANGVESSNPGGVLEIRGDQPTRHWLCDRRSGADLSSRPSVSSNWRARTPMRRRGGNS